MTAKYFAILTNYGAAQLANAVALGTQMNISAMAVGDGGGTLPVPDPAQTKLVRETRRAAVNQVSIDEKNPNFIIAEQVIPENEGGWWIREIGLFDDTGGLIAVGNAPETYKPNLQEGSGRTQVIQMVLMVSSTQAITLKVDPSVVLATREYVTKSIDAAIQESETKAARIYATKTELSSGLSGKQPTGDYATRTELNNGLSGKQPTGDYATKTEVNSKLAKDQNGADIPNKDTFIKNLGLGEKFQPKGNYLPFRTVNKLPGRGFTGAFSGDVNTTYVKGISVASAAGETDTGQFYVDPYAVLTVRYLNSNGAIQQNRIVGIPIGATIEWQSTAPIPENFLANDGRSFSASVYPELAKVFPGLKLPDDRGLFKRALDSGKGYDSGRTLGSVQGDAMRNLTGRFGNPTIEGGDFSEGVFRHSVNSGGRAAGAGGNSIAYSFDASRQVSTANEFRPVNKAVIYITRVI
ncbi:phage tail-collar fiber domain-containing protein [Morganella morganii]|uniref:phage tail-collar fiber domain-containing protein n=5 Tax=Morganella morganii TaxID=582 RepID=UPI002023B796|nr:phage tail protein [Morganella morganii]